MISVPIAQSFRLRPLGQVLPTFDNTFDGIKTSRARTIIPFCQYAEPVDHFLQIATPDDNENFPTLYVIDVNSNTETAVADSYISYIGASKYTTFTMHLSSHENRLCRLKVVQVFNEGDPLFSHLSEPFKVAQRPNFLKLEWYNLENGFMMDYSVDILVHKLYLDAELELQPYKTESSIYPNQDVIVKLEEISNRMFSLKTEVPAYIAEQIKLATAHDHFYINEVEFMTENPPSIARIGNSNLFKVEVDLIQNISVGINTHDVG